MKNIILTVGFLTLGVLVSPDSARADYGAGSNLGFLPFGLYQPYGIRYSTSVRTPPHFAVNPPVYYGSRYARPYGASPFASPPLLAAPASYQADRAVEFLRPVMGPPVCNPYCLSEHAAGEVEKGAEIARDKAADSSSALALTARLPGPIRLNPFVSADEVAHHPSGPRLAR